jgi:hypothetical protein
VSEQPYSTLPDEVMVSLPSRDLGVTITAGVGASSTGSRATNDVSEPLRGRAPAGK